MAAAQGKIGRLLVKRRRPAVLNVGDLVWMDSRHTANDLFKLSVRWFGPSTVLDVNGAQATLDLPQSFGLAHRKINISRLKIFEPRDIELGEPNVRHSSHYGVMMGLLTMRLIISAMHGVAKVLMIWGWN